MDKPVKFDSAGHAFARRAMRELLNQYPGLLEGECIKFAETDEKGGIAFFGNGGAVVYEEKKYISGSIIQKCQYPFVLVYRSSATQKESHYANIVDFLEGLGKWLVGESIVIDNETYQLEKYPEMTDGRKITELICDNVGEAEPDGDGTRNWLLPVTVRYTNTFKKRIM